MGAKLFKKTERPMSAVEVSLVSLPAIETKPQTTAEKVEKVVPRPTSKPFQFGANSRASQTGAGAAAATTRSGCSGREACSPFSRTGAPLAGSNLDCPAAYSAGGEVTLFCTCHEPCGCISGCDEGYRVAAGCSAQWRPRTYETSRGETSCAAKTGTHT